MKIIRALSVIAVLLAAGAAAYAQTLVMPLDGAKLYLQYCATCHGPRGTGNGPMVGALKTKVPDLTLIAKRNRGVFPLDLIQTRISGEKLVGVSHGSREMPVWGPVFSQDISDRDYGKLRVYNVAKFVEGLQK